MSLLREFRNRAFADISAFTIDPFRVNYLRKLLLAEDVHSQLIFGTDYPLPTIPFLTKTTLISMKLRGLLPKRYTIKTYDRIFRRNPLLYNLFLLKTVRFRGKKFPSEVFYWNLFRLVKERNLPESLKKLYEQAKVYRKRFNLTSRLK